jgi:type III secretory pathway component EscS
VEQSFVHLAHAALWVIFLMIVFAIIGVFATIRWLIGLVTGAGRAVESEVSRAGHAIRQDYKE